MGCGDRVYDSLGLLQNEQLLCDYHQLFVKSLSLSEREESSNQPWPRSVSGQVHTNRFFIRLERPRGRPVSRVREGSLLKRRRLRKHREKATHAEGRKFERCSGLEDGCRTGGRGDKHSEVTYNFASLVLDGSKNHLNMDEFFLELLPRNFFACTQTTSGESNRAKRKDSETAYILSMPELLQKHIRACLSRTCFDGSDLEEEKLREALPKYDQCLEEDEVDPSVTAADVKKALAPQSEVTALERVEVAWSSFEEYFALIASIERVFQDSRGRFKSCPAHIITAELLAGLNPRIQS